MKHFIGPFINPISLDKVELIQKGRCTVDQHGTIHSFVEHDSVDDITDGTIIYASEGEFFMPGFVDTHTHAPQFSNIGKGMEYTLLDWLHNVTFPKEASFGKSHAETHEEHYQRVYDHYKEVVLEIIEHGTTTCCYFGSIHFEANIILAQVLKDLGQRALVGKTCMDANSPDYYIEATEESIENTRKFVHQVRELGSGLVEPIITPRFAISCSSKLMSELGSIAKELDVHIQSHLSETKPEIEFVKELFPAHDTYTAVYDNHELLTPKTVMAHCIWLEDEEIEILKSRNCGISHCPNSNFNLRSGVFNVRRYLEAGMKVGLGTDVSGGSSVSIFDAMRQAIIASKVNHFQGGHSPLSAREALFLATLGGSQVLALDHKTGSFSPGKAFDALVIKPKKYDNLAEALENTVFCGDKSFIQQAYCNGIKIY
uniref:Guanine deaminase n=1 Tax=Arcella intermedia TaxID=1963864 RepID=A0A6B2L4W3_9EUKA